jgi:hypothetical protein
MPETTPISAAALGTAVVTAQPVGQFSSNTPVPLPLPDVPEPVAASDVTATTPDGATVHDVVWTPEPPPILRHFEFGHLPEHLQAVSKEFHALAHLMVRLLENGPELSACLRKLLEAKDCAVRAARP